MTRFFFDGGCGSCGFRMDDGDGMPGGGAESGDGGATSDAPAAPEAPADGGGEAAA